MANALPPTPRRDSDGAVLSSMVQVSPTHGVVCRDKETGKVLAALRLVEWRDGNAYEVEILDDH